MILKPKGKRKNLVGVLLSVELELNLYRPTKGVLPDKGAIAVKILSQDSQQGHREFSSEINALSTQNIVTLFGHCVAANNKFLLVYEYQSNGSLVDALFGNKNLKERLNWETRLKICIGIAKGLCILAQRSSIQNEHLNPKISDFGLAKLLNDGEGAYTIVAGTRGYMDPEYFRTGYLTQKSDVYSFGVLAQGLKKKQHLISLLDQDLINFSVNEATKVDIPTPETPIPNPKASSTSLTFEDITYGGDELELGCVEDKIRVLESSGLLLIEGKPLVLMTWNWKLKFDKAVSMKSIPVWVKIYNLPLFLWNPSGLSKVISALGIPICADQKTTKQQRLDSARLEELSIYSTWNTIGNYQGVPVVSHLGTLSRIAN
ncbi:hypothetical protein C5167_024999 [Papaver somniferum]|uniref:Protein kinase domain-containing protein n=1 Tax=Papaver somniferum TaxID=3469 RepID=A0A4Y7JT50_PAPSO|nr:hypothetical protein C5167_024999 [Papaver somniferum]